MIPQFTLKTREGETGYLTTRSVLIDRLGGEENRRTLSLSTWSELEGDGRIYIIDCPETIMLDDVLYLFERVEQKAGDLNPTFYYGTNS